MRVKNLYEAIKKAVEKDPGILDLPVKIQIEYDRYSLANTSAIGYMSQNSFVVEEFYEDPLEWIQEDMGSSCKSIEEYAEKEDPSFEKSFYITI